ncbi:copper resistance protein [Escherichia coli]|nr:copper resistance protein [Escherichia coli]
MSIKNDGHYFCRAGGNRPDGLNEPVTGARESCYYLLQRAPSYFL